MSERPLADVRVLLSNGHSHICQVGRRPPRLAGTLAQPLGFDTETEAIDDSDPYSVPRLALAAVARPSAAGPSVWLLRPSQLADFLLAAAAEHFVLHNAAFDFWVVDRHLRECGRHDALRAWWAACGAGRMHDTMRLDQLLRLAAFRRGQPGQAADWLRQRDLGAVAREYARLELDKQDPYRLRYGELIGADWSAAEPGFFQYAAKDPLATALVWRRLHERALALRRRVDGCRGREVRPGCWEAYGPLTESLQVRGAVALAAAGRRGMRVDGRAARGFEAAVRGELAGRLAEMRLHAPEVFVYEDECTAGGAVRKRRGDPAQGSLFGDLTPEPAGRRVMLTAKSNTPRMKKAELARRLEATAARLGVPAVKSQGKTGGTSLSAKAWAPHARHDPFLAAWSALAKQAKLLGYVAAMAGDCEVHPRYNPLLKTGRVSAYSPNFQQAPRSADFRRLFVARDGRLLLTADYSFIELRTLAAVCLARYGKSVLADVIRGGMDPHSHTAAMISGRPYEQVLLYAGLAKGDPREKDPDCAPCRQARQAAKALNFGLPGGLGAARLAAYAKDSYGVDMTPEEAAAFRKKIVTEVYPELALYLADGDVQSLAWNLGVTPQRLAEAFGCQGRKLSRLVRDLRFITEGQTYKKGEGAEDPSHVTRLWNALNRLTAQSTLPAAARNAARSRKGGKALAEALFGGLAVTPTGRLRGGCTYTQERNTPFQGLAADGAKLALWKVLAAGYDVVGFLHDELIVELDAGGDVAARAAHVCRLMNEAMDEVLGGVPSAVSHHLEAHWVK